MKFWKKNSERSSRSPSNSTSSNPLRAKDDEYILSKKEPAKFVSTSVPSRNQRMQLLSSIIHHADRMQSQFAPKTESVAPSESTSMIKSLTGESSKILSLTSNSVTVIKQMNEKAYNRWQAVLQEGLVPMAVRGLGLLETIDEAVNCKHNDEEQEYFSSLRGMEEEIQMMAILGRAAALRERNDVNDVHEENDTDDDDDMEQINSVMKCTAMLMFYVVMMASTPSDALETKGDEKNAIKSTAGYDGRVRHVLKMSCVDALTRAILQSVEAYEQKQTIDGSEQSEATAQDYSEPKLYDVDEYTLWNLPNIKIFLDEYIIGKEAIFGTIWSKKSSDIFGLLGKKHGSKPEIQQQHAQNVEQQHQLDTEHLSIASDQQAEPDEYPSIEEMHSDLLLTDEIDVEETKPDTEGGEVAEQNDNEDKGSHIRANNEDEMAKISENDSTQERTKQQSFDEAEVRKERLNETLKDENNISGEVINQQSNELLGVELNSAESEQEQQLKTEEEQKEAHLAKRQLNAKFLASRKFELIERMVAIDVVRFLMAEERERKLREKEQKEQKNKFMNVVEMIKKATEDESEKVDESNDGETDACQGDSNQSGTEDIPESSSYWTSHRKKQALRSLKIAGVGLTLGTVFAVTGGLAAPALAAGIGGLASLTGAGTASSTAILAVLATFKAGAALFGVGGGGLAAYKMKKRTDGLSDFSIRRENIEQYMYQGASDAKMKKGIEAMLPHLHTTVAVSGWLRENDVDDFQLAWGICPNVRDEKSRDETYRIRQLKRFYSVYNPKLVAYCEDFMWYLQRKQKKEFSWEKIWSQLEAKYGANPDRMLPIDKPFNDEIFLSAEEKELIDGVLNKTKVVVGKQRGFLSADIDFTENDEIMEFLDKVSPTKKNPEQISDDEIDPSLVENLEERMMNEDISASINKIRLENEEQNLAGEAEYDRKTAQPLPTKDSNAKNIGNYAGGMNLKSSDTDAESTNPTSLNHPQPTHSRDESTKLTDTQSKDYEEDEEEVRCPVVWDWTRLYGSDLHTVTWESKMLSSLCHIVENMAIEVSSQATKAALQFSVIGAIISAVALPSALLTASKLIDDPYQIVVIRADEAGKELAKCLLLSDERRPVTLVGFSFGARVIYSCLRELARQQDIWEEDQNQTTVDFRVNSSTKSKEKLHFQYDREPASLIADVIFIGLPRVIDKTVLTSCRRVTGGRFINCYAKNDWLLSLMFVARGGTPCGTKPILDVPGVENFDVTSLVETHTKYADAIPNILKLVRFCEP